MMKETTFKTLLHYFESRFTFNPNSKRTIGIEKEVLVVDSMGHMADLSTTVWPMVEASKKYKMIYDDYYKDTVVGFRLGDSIVTTDAGIGTFEFILPPVKRVQAAEKLLNQIYKVISPYLKAFDFKMLGLGFQPLAKAAATNWNKKQRYETLVSHYGAHVHYSTLSASDQVHLDLAKEDIIPSTNTFNKLNGFLVALFGNSPIREGKIGDMEPREVLWDSLGKRRTGIPPREFTSVEDYLSYVCKLPFIMAKDGGFTFDPKQTFERFVKNKSPQEAINLYAFHEGTTWFSSRPRIYGTLEIRPCGLQPFSDQMTVSAFCTGLMKNMSELTNFLKPFSWKECREFRYKAAKQGMKVKIRGKSVVPYLNELIKLSEDGLKKRGFDEEKYLAPLKLRVKKGKNPAQEAAEIWKKGKISALLKSRGFVA